jgi:hypothetical protein
MMLFGRPLTRCVNSAGKAMEVDLTVRHCQHQVDAVHRGGAMGNNEKGVAVEGAGQRDALALPVCPATMTQSGQYRDRSPKARRGAIGPLIVRLAPARLWRPGRSNL